MLNLAKHHAMETYPMFNYARHEDHPVLYLTKRHVWGKGGIAPHILIIDEGSASCSGRLTPGTMEVPTSQTDSFTFVTGDT
jgi:hypothetical protein